jgi:hypothetical protein
MTPSKREARSLAPTPRECSDDTGRSGYFAAVQQRIPLVPVTPVPGGNHAVGAQASRPASGDAAATTGAEDSTFSVGACSQARRHAPPRLGHKRRTMGHPPGAPLLPNAGRSTPTCMSWSLCVALLFGASPVDPAPDPDSVCHATKDCVVSTFPGCCGSCCAEPPSARTRKQLQAEQRICATVDCLMPECSNVRCGTAVPPSSAFKAVCRKKRCVLEPLVRQCTKDAECWVTYPPAPVDAACHKSPCGCCPSTVPKAVPATPEPDAPTQSARPAAPSPAAVPVPRTPEPAGPSVQCSPCPGPAAAQAVCVLQQCVLAPPPTPPR